MKKSLKHVLGLVVLWLLDSSLANALFISEWEGTTFVTVKVAPIRSGWDDDPIIYVVHEGDELIVSTWGGHGNGEWLGVTIKANTNVRGCIDVRQTSFKSDIANKKLHQPTQRKGFPPPCPR